MIAKGDSRGFMALSLSALVMNAGLNWILGFGLSVASIDRVQRDAVKQTIAPMVINIAQLINRDIASYHD